MRRSRSRSFLTYDSDVVNAAAKVCEEMTPELETRARGRETRARMAHFDTKSA